MKRDCEREKKTATQRLIPEAERALAGTWICVKMLLYFWVFLFSSSSGFSPCSEGRTWGRQGQRADGEDKGIISDGIK